MKYIARKVGCEPKNVVEIEDDMTYIWVNVDNLLKFVKKNHKDK